MKLFKRLKTEIWRVIKTFLYLGIIMTVVITVVSYGKRTKKPELAELIIDTDAANGIDDLFAMSYAFIHPKIKVTAINAAHWKFHPEGNDSTSYRSEDEIHKLLRLFELDTIPVYAGANEPCGYWGDTKSIPSEAASNIIHQTQQLAFGKKINIITLGAATNLASAIIQDSSIVEKIRWYALTMNYEDKFRIWNKNEFNARNDLDALDFLLNIPELETHLMSANLAERHSFGKVETFDLIEKRGREWDYLCDQWEKQFPDARALPIWDLALLQAIMNPDLVTEKSVWAPPENYKKRIDVYTNFDEKKFMREYRKLVRKHLGDIASDSE